MERKEIVNISDYYLIDIIAVNETFNLTGKKSPTSIGGAMNCPIVF